MGTFRHGVASYKTRGCRCVSCCVAKAEYDEREKQRDLGTPYAGATVQRCECPNAWIVTDEDGDRCCVICGKLE